MEFDNIDISKYLIKLEDTGCALGQKVSLQLADEIKNILKTKEQLGIKDGQFLILETNPNRSAEIWMWTISILSSAWTECVLQPRLTTQSTRTSKPSRGSKECKNCSPIHYKVDY